MGSTKGAFAFEHAAISNMISGLSTRNIEESAREAVLPVSYSNIYAWIRHIKVRDTIEEVNVNGFLMNNITFMPTIPQCVEIYQLCWL